MRHEHYTCDICKSDIDGKPNEGRIYLHKAEGEKWFDLCNACVKKVKTLFKNIIKLKK